jgi:hypothetical protein
LSQQNFEPQGQQFDDEIDPQRYPYSWSGQPRQEGMPRDEPSGIFGAGSGQSGSQDDQPSQVRVPTWVKPQPRHIDPLLVAALVALVIFLVLLAVWVGVASFFQGAVPYLLVVVWGAILALLVFILLLVFFIFRLAFRAVVLGLRNIRMHNRQL